MDEMIGERNARRLALAIDELIDAKISLASHRNNLRTVEKPCEEERAISCKLLDRIRTRKDRIATLCSKMVGP